MLKSFIINLPKQLALVVIKSYQFLLSPDHSWLKINYPYGYCRHYPTCSEYSRQVIEKLGFLKGVYLSIGRIVRCNPWAKPKIDLIPNS